MSKALEKEDKKRIKEIQEELELLYVLWSDLEDQLLDIRNPNIRRQFRNKIKVVNRIIGARKVDLEAHGHNPCTFIK